jgi:hypothetical protein
METKATMRYNLRIAAITIIIILIKIIRDQILARMWRTWNSNTLLMGL